MKASHNFGIIYILLLICQVMLCNYTNLGPYVMLTMLPAMILCIPTRINAAGCLLIAFASGFLTKIRRFVRVRRTFVFSYKTKSKKV